MGKAQSVPTVLFLDLGGGHGLPRLCPPYTPYATARGPMIAKRSLPEIQSIAATATRIIRIRNDTFCHSSTRICSASCKPMPPAPTMPMIVAERVFELDEIEHLARDHGQHLRHQAEADFVQCAAAGGADTLDLLPICGLDRLRKELAERSAIGDRDGEHSSERPKADDVDPDQRPDQDIDAADRIQEPANGKANEIGGHDVARGKQTDGQRRQRGERRAQKCDRQRFAECFQVERQRGARIGRQHHQRDPAELMKARDQTCRREVEIDQPEREDAKCDDQHRRGRQTRRGRPVEDIRVARPQRVLIRRRPLAHVRASLPNNRPRSQPVAISMQNTVTTIITRIALTSE